MVARPMEAARRQGITRRRHHGEANFGWAINAQQLASRSQPVDSSTSGAASRPCSPVLPYSGGRGEGKGRLKSLTSQRIASLMFNVQVGSGHKHRIQQANHWLATPWTHLICPLAAQARQRHAGVGVTSPTCSFWSYRSLVPVLERRRRRAVAMAETQLVATAA